MSRIAFVLAVLALAVPAHAGIADGPLPSLQDGVRTVHVYSVPGVVSDGFTGTFFSCTSTAEKPIAVSVEVFPPGGGSAFTSAAADVLIIDPGATMTWATRGATGCAQPSLVVDRILAGCGVGLARPSSARILSTSKAILCNAFTANVFEIPPPALSALPVVAKTTQKGD